jgi:hypothetical protein
MRAMPVSGINKAPVLLGRGGAVPGTAMRRAIGTSSGVPGTSAGRPMTAVSGAGYNSKQAIPGNDATTVVLETKIEK